jgi:DNA adenine methylase
MKSPLRYNGGKGPHQKFISEQIKPHKIWVDLCCGGLNVTLGKPKSEIEVCNDIDDDLINFYRHAGNIVEAIQDIEYSEESFEWACDYKFSGPVDETEAAIKFLVRNRMSRDGNGEYYMTSPRTRRGMPEHISSWKNVQETFSAFADRIKDIEFRCMQSLDLLGEFRHDENVCIYIDYPYLMGKRTTKKLYKYEVSENDHISMLNTVQGSRAQILISHYSHPIYESALDGWNRCEKPCKINMGGVGKNGKSDRIEVLWSNK